MNWVYKIQKAIDYIESNLTEKLSVDEVAKAAIYSPTPFQYLFSAMTGYSVGEYIRFRRLSCAADDLADNKLSVTDAAFKYQYETVEAFSKLYPDAELWLICGSDMFLTLDEWRDPERIFALCRVAAVPRHQGDVPALTAKQKILQTKFQAKTQIIPALVMEVSSTQIRDGAARELIPPEIAAYIQEHHLFE